ncbi:DUF5131 family protein [Treponema denticola]|uniref:DUF5131 family protein n=2 Tax=Treponema denticola TaxID=158 RepID=UPI0002B5659A|nr:DUF5131 family protein [Treponema denticola]EMB37586.1 hypothetical protein HMPREF9722_02519 [Treponema denticola ATCC 33520]
MPLNKSIGNMYEFITHTWNTIKGKCPHGCSYCYMKRWGKQPPLHFDEKELKTDLGKNNFIFVGSSCDMFAKNIPFDWVYETLEHCKKHTENEYLLQTKNTDNLALAMFFQMLNEYFSLCTTLETNRTYRAIMNNSPSIIDRVLNFAKIPAERKYITIEPIMDFDLPEFITMIKHCNPRQVNIGADSNPERNRLPEPPKGKILELIAELETFTKVVKKKNLKRILK